MFFGSAQINVEVNIPLREMEKVALPVLQPRPDQSEEGICGSSQVIAKLVNLENICTLCVNLVIFEN